MGKNQPKKLMLNRQTVRDLTNVEMQNVEGAGNQPFTNGCHTKTGDPCIYCVPV